MEKYDSYFDTKVHQNLIKLVMDLLIIKELSERKTCHDRSKLDNPEKPMYDKFIPILRTAKYGTDEYKKIRDDMYEEGLKHHYESNRHHPEHFKNGIEDMNIIDFVEMLSDWFAASLKSDTSFMEGLSSNIKKYNIPPMMEKIIINTYNDLFKNFEEGYKDENKNKLKDFLISLYRDNSCAFPLLPKCDSECDINLLRDIIYPDSKSNNL